MQKKRNKLLIILLSIFLIIGCSKKITDASKIKQEYESLNSSLIKVNIENDNPFVINEEEDIESLIQNKESFVVFYATSKDSTSRNMIETIIKVSKEVGLNKVYYVNRNDNTNLTGYIDGDVFYKLSENNYEEMFNLINEVAVKLNTCNIEVGC